MQASNQPLLGHRFHTHLVRLAALRRAEPEVGIEQWGVQYLIASLLQSRRVDADLDAESTQVLRFPGLQEVGDGNVGDRLDLVPPHRFWEVGLEPAVERLDGMHDEGIYLVTVLLALG